MCVVRQQDGESRSGLGSTTAATVSMKLILGRVIDHVKAELGQDTVTLLDSSCGDMNWMPGFLRARPGDVLYTGLDIVATNIEASTADDPSVSQSLFTITISVLVQLCRLIVCSTSTYYLQCDACRRNLMLGKYLHNTTRHLFRI